MSAEQLHPLPAASIVDCMADDDAFGPWFEGSSWNAWKAILKAAYALPRSPADRAVVAPLAGNRDPPAHRVRELWVVAGRRAGKDSIASLIIGFAAGIEQAHLGKLRPGERATVMCIATDREQAQIVKGYSEAYFDEIPELGAMVESRTRNGFLLNNGVEILITTNSFRHVRGRTVLLAVLDELAFWRDESSANPDIELYRALLPSMVTLPGSMLIGISSPYRKAGLLYDKHKRHFAKNDDNVLVIQATSQQLNPEIPDADVEQALADDPAVARAEWLGEFRSDIGAFLPLELIEGAVDVGVTVRPPRSGVRYQAFVDASSGAGQDSFGCGIVHPEGEQAIVDCAYEIRPPFSTEAAMAEIAALLKSYGVRTVVGDKYSLNFVLEGFARSGIDYTYSERDRSQIYVNVLPLFTSGRVRLVDSRKLVMQFASLERRTSAGGKDSVDHGRNSHDDLCNAVAGALTLISDAKQPMKISPAVMARVRAGRPQMLRRGVSSFVGFV
jgi:hypothetical protein